MALRLLIFAIFSLVLAAPCVAQAKTKPVQLKEFTRFSLNIAPYLGTQLVFPFDLDGSMEPKLQISETNKVGFTAAHKEHQNTVLITANVPKEGGAMPPYKGIVYITVGGYHVTIELSIAKKSSKQYTDVVFSLPSEKREYLIAEAVKQRTAQLEEQYAARLAKLDEQAEQGALALVGELSFADPDSSGVKVAEDVVLPPNVSVELYADKWRLYPSFGVLRFEMTNHSPQKVAIDGVQLLSIDKDNSEVALNTGYHCSNGFLSAEGQVDCTLTTRDLAGIRANELRLVVITDRGEAQVVW